MKRLLCAWAVVALAACDGQASNNPAPIPRPINGTGDSTDVADASDDVVDAGDFVPDAGLCCQVTFTVPAEEGDQTATLVFGSEHRTVALTRAGDTWSGALCVALVDSFYFFEVGTQSEEDDGGLFVVDRVNPAQPVEPGTVVDSINLFSVNGAASCEALDGGAAGDAGTSDAGASDAGAADAGATDASVRLPVETSIPGACDLLDTPTVLLVSDGGTMLDEEETDVLALPFSMQYFGAPVTHFVGVANGYLQLTTASGVAQPVLSGNVGLPDPTVTGGLVAPFWDDLYGVSDSSLRTQTFGTAPLRHFTVEWTHWSFFVGTDERVTFQAQLFEGTNAIEFHYCALEANGTTTTFERGFGATVGLQSLDGTAGVLHSQDSAVLTVDGGLHYE
jgi:hypothetical protein